MLKILKLLNVLREKCLEYLWLQLHGKVIMIMSIIFIVITSIMCVSNNNYINN